jgi:dipeptidyl aminopeptidase/acylaminoacyl peptidase
VREDDLLKFRWIADPRISPDGTRVAFTLVRVDADEDEYRTDLWIADVPVSGGSAPGATTPSPRALTFDGRSAQPRWSPDGSALAFVRRAEGAKPQLHVLPLAGGEARALTKLEKGVSSPAWSPDGKRIAFLSGHDPDRDLEGAKKPKHEPARVVTRPEFRWNNEGFTDFEHLDHVWVVGAGTRPEDGSGAEPRRLTKGGRFKEWALAWSRDGKHVVFATDRREAPWHAAPAEDNDLRAVAADLDVATEGETMRVVADIAGPIAQWIEGPDGRIAAVGGIRPAKPNTYEANDLLLFEGSWPQLSPKVLTDGLDLHVGEGVNSDQHPPRGGGELPLGFTADGKAVVFAHSRRGAAHLALCDLASRRVEDLTGPDQEVIAGTVSADGRRVALTIGSLESPGDLHVYDLERRTLTRLWGPNDELLDGAALVEAFDYPSFDGTKIQAWLVKPADFDPKKKYPLVLEIHGGPHTAYGFGFFHEFRVLAAAGYVVLYTNPRGSTSYGQGFADCIQYKFPGDDYKDLMAGVEHVVARGFIDDSRMGVTGGSGGGLLTNWIVCKTNRFAAAITQRCVADWAAMWSTCDFSLFQPFWFRGAPWEDPKDFAERSPVTHLANIETPLMVLHSEEDWRTPIGQGEAMFRGLLYRKKPTVMVRFPGENHELSRSGTPSRRVQNQQHIRRWFDHWLMGRTAPEYGVPEAASMQPAPAQLGGASGGTK